MEIQAKIPPALAATHNFIMEHDPEDIDEYLEDNANDLDPNPGAPHEHDFGVLFDRAVTAQEKNRATEARDRLAQSMWEDYQQVCQGLEQRGYDDLNDIDM